MKKPARSRRSKPAVALGPRKRYFIESITHEAKGVARVDGKVTFIEGALPNEIVEARVYKTGRHFDEAQLLTIEQVSDHRVTPACVHYAECGGCRFQHLEYAQQLVAKQTWLQGQLRKIWTQDDITILQDQPLSYRRRARFSVRVQSGKVLLGFRGASSNTIVDIEQCIVLTPALQILWSALRHFVQQISASQHIGHIELLEDDIGCAIVVRLTGVLPDAVQEQWQHFAKTVTADLYWQSPAQSQATLGDHPWRSYSLWQWPIRFHPQDFIQVNAAMNLAMVQQALDWLALSSQDTLLDLFCGAGNFSIPCASQAKQVIGVELLDSMVAQARYNAQANQLDNVNFIAADLTQPLPAALLKYPISHVLLDPPRAGAFECLANLVNMAPTKIVYVSCNASTLARDAEFLVANGYTVERVVLMEMFPQTAHVETMMLLRKSRKQKG